MSSRDGDWERCSWGPSPSLPGATVQLAVGAAVALLPGNAVSLVINAQVLNGFITPVLLTYILILANRRSVLGDAANGPVFRAVATLCVTVVGLLSAVVLVQTVAGWL